MSANCRNYRISIRKRPNLNILHVLGQFNLPLQQLPCQHFNMAMTQNWLRKIGLAKLVSAMTQDWFQSNKRTFTPSMGGLQLS